LTLPSLPPLMRFPTLPLAAKPYPKALRRGCESLGARPRRSAPPACPALNVAIGSVERLASWLHPLRLTRGRLRCREARRNTTPDRNQRLVTAFRSPAATLAFASTAPGSTFPACCFTASPAASRARSASRSAAPGGLPHPEPLQRLKPVAPSTTSAPGCAFSSHSPLGFLHPAGSKRSAEFAVRQSAFRSARFPFAPRCGYYR
jgi:hypothetical protein